MRKKLLVGAAAAALATGGVVAVSVPAGASPAEDCWNFTITTDSGADACFVPTGEHLYVADQRPDGHHPGVWYQINGGTWHNRQFNIGYRHRALINLDLAESSRITFYAVNYEGADAVSVSDTITVSARG